MKVFEYRGVRGLVCAELINDDSETIEYGTPFEVVATSEIGKTTETSSEAHYYDNIPAIVIDSTGSDEITISGSGIPEDILAKITGQVWDESKGMLVEGERESKYFAIGYITKKTDGTEVFVWRLKGKFSVPDSTHHTEDDGTDANGQELTFTGINTNHKFEVTENGTKKTKTAKAVVVPQDKNKIEETVFFESVMTPDKVPAITV